MENPVSVQKLLAAVKEKLKDEPKLYEMFETCYTNTLNKTVKILDDGTTYVITGDIPAMWQRDSVAQLRPYLIPAKEDEELAALLEGLVRRQFDFVRLDPYANAFNDEPNGKCWERDDTDQWSDWLWERKYEVDSLCYPLQLAYLLWKNTGRTSQFDEIFLEGTEKILDVWETEQYHEEKSPYYFIRNTDLVTESLSRNGKGALVKSGIGMTWSGFRPSDDACVFGYLVPSNMFAVVVLGYLAEIAEKVLHDEKLKARAEKLRGEIYEGIENYAIAPTAFGRAYAYEVDGQGLFNFMDDANVPSLLAMEYLGYQGKDPKVAENTKKLILSEANPYYYSGTKASGIGSPHTPLRYIWHISLAIEGLSADSKEEKLRYLHLLADTDGGKGLMHEGFHVDDPTQYTREWFSWANAMFSELVLDYCGYKVEK